MNARLCLLFAFVACGDDAVEPPPFRHQELQSYLRDAADHFTMRAGDWKEDYGDGAFFGTAFNAAVRDAGVAHAVERSDLGLQHNLEVISTEALIGGDANELIMSYHGALEYVRTTGDRAALDVIDEHLPNLALGMELVGYHIAPDLVPGWAMRNYGPVAIGSLLASLFARRAALDADPLASEHWDTALALAEQIDANYWRDNHYEHGVREGLHLYPNVAAAALYAELYLIDGKTARLERAKAAYAAVQSLRLGSGAGATHYRSPYSQGDMGATTDDYSTLSGQNYLMLALHSLYRATGDNEYLREVDRLLDFIDAHLRGDWCLGQFHDPANIDLVAATCEDDLCAGEDVCVDGGCETNGCHPAVLHHWIDGRVASTEDPVLLCTGCNLQLLYVLWERAALASGD